MPGGLGAVAADGHVAPQTAAVPGAVQKQPAAMAALLQSFRISVTQEAKRRKGGCRQKAGGRATKPESGRELLQQIGKGQRIVPAGNPSPEMRIYRLPQLQQPGLIFCRHRFQHRKKRALSRMGRCRVRQALPVFRIREPVHPAFGIGAQDHAVGNIQRQCAAGKAMRGPGKGHDENITGKMHFASYILAEREDAVAYLVQQLVLALPLAGLYAALAFGYSLAFGVTRRADIAYGAFFAFGGQIYVLFVDLGWNAYRLIMPAALAFGALASLFHLLLVGRFAGRQIMGRLVPISPNAVIVAALGLLMMLMETARLVSGTRDLWLPPLLAAPIPLLRIDGQTIVLTGMQAVNIAAFSLIVLCGCLLLAHTRLGRVWRAVTDDPKAAALCGVNAERVFAHSYLAAVLIAGLSGMLATNYYGNMDFGSGLMFGLKVLLIAAVGGYGSPLRSAFGAAVLGLVETLWGAFAPFVWRDLVVFSGLVLVLTMTRREEVIP